MFFFFFKQKTAYEMRISDWSSDVCSSDLLAFPASSPEMLAKFPPTLVLSSSRDALLGNALDTYARLVDAKVESQLYVREGFGHGYFTQAPEIPEAIAAWRVTVDFFDRHLFRAK